MFLIWRERFCFEDDMEEALRFRVVEFDFVWIALRRIQDCIIEVADADSFTLQFLRHLLSTGVFSTCLAANLELICGHLAERSCRGVEEIACQSITMAFNKFVGFRVRAGGVAYTKRCAAP